MNESKYTPQELGFTALQAIAVRGTWGYLGMIDRIRARTGLTHHQVEARIERLANNGGVL